MKTLLLLLTTAFISSIAYSSDDLGQDAHTGSLARKKFADPTEMVGCMSSWIASAQAGHYQQTLNTIEGYDEFSSLGFPSVYGEMNIEEMYGFCRSYAQVLSHIGLANQHDSLTTKEQKIEHYKKIGNIVDRFEEKFGHTSQDPEVKMHLYLLYENAGNAFQRLAVSYYFEPPIDFREIFMKSIGYYGKAIKTGDGIKSQKDIETLHIEILRQWNNFYQYFPAERNQTNRELNRSIETLKKSSDSEIRQQTAGIITSSELWDRAQRAKISTVGTEKYRKKMISNCNKEIVDLHKAFTSSALVSQSSENNIMDLHASLMTEISYQLDRINSRSKDLAGSEERRISAFSTIKGSILNIEQEILNILSASPAKGSAYTTLDIYREYYRLLEHQGLLRSQSFQSIARCCLSSLIINGDLEEALERAQVFEDLLKENDDPSLPIIHLHLVYTKNLLGDHTEWLEIEEQSQKKAAQNKKKKDAQKERNRKARVETIHESLKATAEEEQESHDREEERLKNLQEQKAISASAAILSNPAAITEVEIVPPQIKKKKPKKNKIEHVDEEKTEAVSTASSITEPEEAIEKMLSLRELYGLSGVSLIVDTSIENNDWQITRENLITYFNAMGCTHRNGKGSHEISSLPSSLIFEKNGEVVTVISDSGGSLTLPKWEASNVPHYLRKQISLAREKLVALGMKAQRT